MNSHRKSQKGFTILVAVITASILLIVAMSIGGIALKEQTLSIANKESQFAYYAADTGMECALYWDQKKGAFSDGNTGPVNNTTNPVLLAGLHCNGNTLSLTFTTSQQSSTYDYAYIFQVTGIQLGYTGVTTCAVVEVDKKNTVFTNTTPTATMIHSYGYNTCGASLNRIERGVVANY